MVQLLLASLSARMGNLHTTPVHIKQRWRQHRRSASHEVPSHRAGRSHGYVLRPQVSRPAAANRTANLTAKVSQPTKVKDWAAYLGEHGSKGPTIQESFRRVECPASRSGGHLLTFPRYAGQHSLKSVQERVLVLETWTELLDQSETSPVICEAWLHAAESCPIWIWGLVGIDEAMQSDAVKSHKFQALVKGVSGYLTTLIKTHHLDSDTARDMSYKLGVRHRAFFDMGYQAAYWEPFTTALGDLIARHPLIKTKFCQQSYYSSSNPSLQMTLPTISTIPLQNRTERLPKSAESAALGALHSFRHRLLKQSAERQRKLGSLTEESSGGPMMLRSADSSPATSQHRGSTKKRQQRSRSLVPSPEWLTRRRSSADKEITETMIRDAWNKFMRIVVEAMHEGYAGEVGPVRLSLTSSILSLSSLRSGPRTRSASRQQSVSPRHSTIDEYGNIIMAADSHRCPNSEPRLTRRKSIFRPVKQRESVDVENMRKLSSPSGSMQVTTVAGMPSPLELMNCMHPSLLKMMHRQGSSFHTDSIDLKDTTATNGNVTRRQSEDVVKKQRQHQQQYRRRNTDHMQ